MFILEAILTVNRARHDWRGVYPIFLSRRSDIMTEHTDQTPAHTSPSAGVKPVASAEEKLL